MIIDIALQHTPSLNEFLSKIDFKDSTIYRFFCDCSDDNIWLERWRTRLKKTLPNQYFKSIDEIIEHYGKCEIGPLNGEIILDSIIPVDDLVDIAHVAYDIISRVCQSHVINDVDRSRTFRAAVNILMLIICQVCTVFLLRGGDGVVIFLLPPIHIVYQRGAVACFAFRRGDRQFRTKLLDIARIIDRDIAICANVRDGTAADGADLSAVFRVAIIMILAPVVGIGGHFIRAVLEVLGKMIVCVQGGSVVVYNVVVCRNRRADDIANGSGVIERIRALCTDSHIAGNGLDPGRTAVPGFLLQCLSTGCLRSFFRAGISNDISCSELSFV